LVYYLVLTLIILAVPGLLVTVGRSANTATMVRTTVGSIAALLLLGAIDQFRTGNTTLLWTWVLFAVTLPLVVALVVRITGASGFPRSAQWFLSLLAAVGVVVVISLLAARAAGPPSP